jgi:hypothetical protein
MDQIDMCDQSSHWFEPIQGEISTWHAVDQKQLNSFYRQPWAFFSDNFWSHWVLFFIIRSLLIQFCPQWSIPPPTSKARAKGFERIPDAEHDLGGYGPDKVCFNIQLLSCLVYLLLNFYIKSSHSNTNPLLAIILACCKCISSTIHVIPFKAKTSRRSGRKNIL